MPQKYLRKYGVAATLDFTLYEVDGVDFRVDATFAAGDLKIMKDEGAEANTTNLPTDEGIGYSQVLTATEMQAARLVVYLTDQTATKVWLDDYLVIETYGNASAQHAFDLDTALVTLAAVTHTGATIPTVTTLTGHTAQTGDSFARLGAPSGASLSSDIAAVKTEADKIALADAGAGVTGSVIEEVENRATATQATNIETDTQDIQSRLPAVLVGGRMDADVGAVSTSTDAANNLERSTLGIVLGTVGVGSSTTSIVTSSLDPAASSIDQFKGRIMTFDRATTTANLRGQSTDIAGNTALGVLTVTAVTTAPVSGDTFTIT